MLILSVQAAKLRILSCAYDTLLGIANLAFALPAAPEATEAPVERRL